MKYEIRFTSQALKDVKKLSANLAQKLKGILEEVISVRPYSGKKLWGDLLGYYSYRLNIKDRILYSINEKKKRVVIKRARTHYGE